MTLKELSADVAARSEKIAEQLRHNDVVALGYKQPPIIPELFILNADKSNIIRLWAGQAEIEIHPSRKLRQAVLTSHEEAREVVRKVSFRRNDWANLKDPHYDKKQATSDAVGLFPVSIPGAKLQVIDLQVKDRRENELYRGDRPGQSWFMWTLSATVKATAPGSTTSFLIGMDETRQFISQLPQVVSSVEEAHSVLRPNGLPDNALRQGEWFFIPADDDLQARIEKALPRKHLRYDYSDRGGVLLEPGSTHHVSHITNFLRQRYVRGTVTDERRTRHHPLELGERWYRVVRNREVVQEPGIVQRRRYWD